MSDDARLTQAAAALWNARATRRAIPPVARSFDVSGLDQAYRVAAINTAARIAQGARIVGRKVGLTSPAVQQQLGVDRPDFGVLFDDMEFLDGDTLPAARLLQPRVEAEVALVVRGDFPARRPSWSEYLHGLAYALPALEVVDSAIADWKITLEDTVADNASCGLYVLGLQPVDVGALDLRAVGMELRRNGAAVSSGSGAACLGHPLRAGYWLAATLAERGEPLRAGEVVLTGALGPMVPVAAGDVVQAGLGALGTVCCRFA